MLKRLLLLLIIIGSASISVGISTKVFNGVSAQISGQSAEDNENVERESRINNNTQFGVNLARISDWSTQYPFIDLMKQARAWNNGNNTPNNHFNTDQNDWVLSLDDDQVATTYFHISTENDPPYLHKAHVFFDGEGTIRFAGSKIIESSSGYRLISLGTGNHALHIKTINPSNPIRNIKIIPDRFLAAYEKGEIFNPDFLQKMQSMAGIRFMNWMITNNSEQQYWQNRPKLSHRTWRTLGVPLEVMIQLSNTLNTNPWFNIPHLADKEYIASVANILKSHLAPHLTIYVEHSNEVWNGQFAQANYAKSFTTEIFMDSKRIQAERLNLQWHSQRTATICDVFKHQVFVQEQSRIKCVLGMQTVSVFSAEHILECPAFKPDKRDCFEHGFDYIGITTYFDGHLTGNYSFPELHDTLLMWANEPDKYLDKAMQQLQTGEPFRHHERLAEYQGAIKNLESYLLKWKRIAKKYDLGLVAYEGGQHVNAQNNELRENQQFVDFLGAVNTHPVMESLYLQVGELWQKHGGMHMFYSDITRQGKSGYWGALEHVTQTESAKWNAIQQLIAENKKPEILTSSLEAK